MVTLTENAIAKVKEFYAADPETKGKSLRIAVEPSGCAGLQYAFGFDMKKEGDQELSFDSFTVLLDSHSAQVLAGSTIDYNDEGTSSGLKISNPNVKKSCGCGQSFSV